MKQDENPTEAAVREAEEELGVNVSLEKPFFSGEFMHKGEIYLWHGYISEIESGEPELQEEKFSELEWFEGTELDDLDLAPNLRQILPALRRTTI